MGRCVFRKTSGDLENNQKKVIKGGKQTRQRVQKAPAFFGLLILKVF